MKHFVVMGVSGCGKSTVAALLAQRLDATMIEADALHGEKNIAKMQRGEPLCDEDRWPWLSNVAAAMQASRQLVIVSCSALRRAYRDSLLDNVGVPIGFIHLHADQEIIETRVSERKGHFMPPSLLNSQYQLLEPLQSDELGVVVDINQTVEQVTNDAMFYVQSCVETWT